MTSAPSVPNAMRNLPSAVVRTPAEGMLRLRTLAPPSVAPLTESMTEPETTVGVCANTEGASAAKAMKKAVFMERLDQVSLDRVLNPSVNTDWSPRPAPPNGDLTARLSATANAGEPTRKCRTVTRVFLRRY